MSGIEILGIAASVIQIADGGARLSSKLFVFTRKVKNADQSISNISGEIAATGAALRQLGEALEDDKYASLGSKQSIDTTNQIVADCWKVFTDINDTIGGGQLVRQKGQYDAKNTVALAQIKQPSFGFKQRLRFPNRPRLAVSEEQKALLQTLIDERNAKEAECRSSCMAIEKAPIATSDLESFNTSCSTSADTSVTDEQEMKGASTARAIPALCEPGNASNVFLAQSVPQPWLKQPFTRTETTKTIAETSAPSSPSVTTLTPVSSITEADTSSSSDKTLPRSLQMRQRDIEHHALLVQNLLDEIGHVQYQVDHGIRHRMHDGVLKLHWDAWLPHASKHGHEHFRKSFGKHEHIARYWVDQYEDGVRVSSSTPAGSNDIAKEHVHFTDAVGRKYNIPLEQCQSWYSMNELIIRKFAHIEDLAKPISQGRFDLQADDGSIILPQFWSSVVKPGIEVNMLLWALQEPAQTPEALPMAQQGQDAIFKLDDPLPSPKKKNKTTEKSTNKTKTPKKPDEMLDHKRSTPVLNLGTQAGTDSVLDVRKTTNSPELQVDAKISMPDPEVFPDEEQIRACHELFSDFDLENKGRISRDILEGALEAFLAIMGYSGTLEVDTEALLDLEKDLGGLSSEGIDMNLFTRCAARSSQIQEAYEDSTVLLRIFDTKNEEVNDGDELKEVIRSLGGAISDEEYDVFLHEHAQSGTRQLGYADCLGLLRRAKLLSGSEVETVTKSIAEDSDEKKPLAVVKLHRRTYRQHLKAVQEHEQWRNLERPLIGIEDHDPEVFTLEDALEAGTIRNGEIITHVGADWPRWAFAMWDYTGTTEADLSFGRGDIIEILSEGDGAWLVGRLGADLRKTGFIPSNHVSYMPIGFVPDAVTRATRHSRVVASEEVDETQTKTKTQMSGRSGRGCANEGLDHVIEKDKQEAKGEELDTMRVPDTSATSPNTSYVREWRGSPRTLKRRAPRKKPGDEPNDRKYCAKDLRQVALKSMAIGTMATSIDAASPHESQEADGQGLHEGRSEETADGNEPYPSSHTGPDLTAPTIRGNSSELPVLAEHRPYEDRRASTGADDRQPDPTETLARSPDRSYTNRIDLAYTLASDYTSDPELRRRKHEHDKAKRQESRIPVSSGSSNIPDTFHGVAGGGFIGDLTLPAWGTDRDAQMGLLGDKDYRLPSEAELAQAAKRFSEAQENWERLRYKHARWTRRHDDESRRSGKEDLVDNINMFDDKTETSVFEAAMGQHVTELSDLLSEFTTLGGDEIMSIYG